jgi:HAD superfamily hydrolase (TIGR01490 family)
MKNLCLFDLDHTLLPLDSDHAWGAFVVEQGWADPIEFGRSNDAFYAEYQAGTLDIHAYIDFTTKPWRNLEPMVLSQAQEKFMQQVIVPHIHESALDLVANHLEQGDKVALITATNEFVTTPIAKALGIEHLLAVRLVRDAKGQINGKIKGTPSFREGKIARTQEWLLDQGQTLADFENIWVYSDSINDLPLLEMATHPVATNPAASLEAIALQKGWPILQLFH